MAFFFGDGEPDEGRSVVRVVAGKVGGGVLVKVLVVRLHDEPETLLVSVLKVRVDPVIICENACGVLSRLFENGLDALNVVAEILERSVFEIVFGVLGNGLRGLLDAREVHVEVLLTGLAEEGEDALGGVVADFPDRNCGDKCCD